MLNPIVGMHLIVKAKKPYRLFFKYCYLVTMSVQNRSNWTRIIKQSVIWLCVFGIYYLFFNYNNTNYSYSISISAVITALTFAVTFAFTKYLFPKFLFPRKYLIFALYSFYIFVFASYAIVVIIYAFLFFMFNFSMEMFPAMSKNFLSIFLLISTITGLICFGEILKFNHQTSIRNGELKYKITETQLELKTQELGFLRSQLNPHFLFNTLNTLYGLSIKQSELTSNAILKLSNLLNYSLYQANKTSVLLKDEIEHLDEYMEMETLRFRERLEIRRDIAAIPEHFYVPPMLLLTFVENAFKHGRTANSKLKISLRLKIIEDQMLFIVVNSIPSIPEGIKQGGLGLKSMNKRLKITYNDGYTLRTGKTSNAFFSVLIIDDLKINTTV